MRYALAAIAVLCACKEKQEASPAKPSTPAPEAVPAQPTSPPALPAPKPTKPSKPITIEEAKAALPTMPGNPIIALKQTSDQLQVHGTWCIDGTSADDVAKQIGQAMAQAKYTGLAIRGDARKAGVAGDRDGVRMSMV